ncbi:MAG TPA: LppX_LprAFG lipoprotein [Candidatus Limnocylindrales bacterium]
MIRRLAACLAVVAIVAGACGGTSAPALTDPKDILTQSVASLSTLKSAHVHLDVAGTFNADLQGTGTPTAIDLQGTTADMDIDLPNKKIHASFGVPALLGLSGDLIQIGSDQYIKISLVGPKYKKSTTPTSTTASSSPPTDPQTVIAGLKDGLSKLTTPPVKDADEKVGDQDCYKVTLKLTAADLSGAGAPLPSGTTGDGTIDVWVRKNDLRPAKLLATINAGTQGTLTVTVTISNIDSAVTIDAPPADQIDTTP